MLAVSLQTLYGKFLILFSTPGLWRGHRTPIEDFLSFNSGQRLIISISIASCQTSGHDGRKLLRRLAQGQWPFAMKNSHEKFLSFKTTLSLTVSFSFPFLHFNFLDPAYPSLAVTLPCARRQLTRSPATLLIFRWMGPPPDKTRIR